MFLAWNEIKHSKTRFALIVGVMFLVSYLVFFLTGLAYGLAQDNRTSIDKWDADAIVLTDESNLNINMSMMPRILIEDIQAKEVASIGQTPGVVRQGSESSDSEKININFFGVNRDEFIMPEVIEGEAFKSDYEAIADYSLFEEKGVEIGDTLYLAGSDLELEVVGFTDDAKYAVSPVLYVTSNTYQEVRFESVDKTELGRISAFVIRDDDLESVKINNDKLALYDINDYIAELPGYMAQLLTFGLMIGFLILIAAIVIGIFMYVLTVQKSSMFGVMKAQGISTSYIGKSVVSQTFLLSFFGVGIGFALTMMTAVFLPAAVPFRINYYFFSVIALLLIIFAILGAFFSVRTIVKIDPLEAIG